MKAGVCGHVFVIDRPVVSVKVQEIALILLTSQFFLRSSVSSAAHEAQGRQLGPHRQDCLFAGMQRIVCLPSFSMRLYWPNWQIAVTTETNL